MILAKPKSKRQVGAVASSLLGIAKSGFVRSFLFNLVGPVLDNLKSVGHKEAAKAVAKHIIPYTGLKIMRQDKMYINCCIKGMLHMLLGL